MFNSVNRSAITVAVGAVAATKEVGFIYADKKMIVRNVNSIDIAAVAADPANYVEVKLRKNGDLIANSEASTVDGLAARESLPVPMQENVANTKTDGILLEKGDFLSVSYVVTATGALTNASLHADVEIVGN